MGVLNVTPDSFSDGGRFADSRAAADAATEMIAAGAEIIDIGGESTRPGALPVDAEEQIRRVQPVIAAIRRQSAVVLSVDTTRWDVARAALDAGVDLVNDVSAGRDDPQMLPGVAAAAAPIILMHMQGLPQTMQRDPNYTDVTAEVVQFLCARANAARDAGVESHRVLLDPGIGFGKTVDHNLQLLHDLPVLGVIGQPLVIGASRKSFIGKVLEEPDPLRRVFGDAAVISWAVTNGAAIVRVHDVGEATQVVKMVCAIRER
jgi:dihydropteroate synthase